MHYLKKKIHQHYKPADILASYRPLPGEQEVTLTKINSVLLRSNYADTGGMIGFVAGAGIILVGIKTHEANDNSQQSTKETVAAVTIGGVICGITGYLLGSIFPKWSKIYQR